jgi:hypothetical protein
MLADIDANGQGVAPCDVARLDGGTPNAIINETGA